MRLHRLVTVGLFALSFAAASAIADTSDKAKKQAEIRGKANSSLDAFYKADPKLKARLAKKRPAARKAPAAAAKPAKKKAPAPKK